MELEQLKERVVAAAVDLYRNGLVRNTGAGGNVSARDPETGVIAVTPSKVRYDTMKADDIVLIDLAGKILETKYTRKPTSESLTHRLILKEFPQMNAVIHTHSPYANAMALVYDYVPAVVNETAFFCGKTIPVSKFVVPGTDEMAREVVRNLKKVPAMIIANHGPVVMGQSLDVAVQRALVVEDSAKIFCFAKMLGDPRLLSEENCERTMARANV